MLSDKDIKKALEDKWIEISPLDQGYIQPSSVDLRVGTEFRVFENHKYSHIDPKSPQEDLTTLVEASKGMAASGSWPFQVNLLQGDGAPIASVIPEEGVTGWADTRSPV